MLLVTLDNFCPINGQGSCSGLIDNHTVTDPAGLGNEGSTSQVWYSAFASILEVNKLSVDLPKDILNKMGFKNSMLSFGLLFVLVNADQMRWSTPSPSGDSFGMGSGDGSDDDYYKREQDDVCERYDTLKEEYIHEKSKFT